MMIDPHFFQFPVMLATLFLAGLTIFSWQKQSTMISRPFMAVTAIMTLWSMLYAMQITSPSLLEKAMFQRLGDAVIAFLPVAWVAMSAEYTGHAHHASRPRLALLAVIPMISAVLSLTSQQHNLFRYDFSMDFLLPVPALISKYGVGAWVFFLYSYGMMALTGVMLAIQAARTHGPQRSQAFLLLAGSLPPVIFSILNTANLNPIRGFDLTSIAFAISSLIVAWGLFGQEVMDLAPVARDRVIERIRDGVVVVNAAGQLVEINPAGRRILLGPAGEGLRRGHPATALFARHPALAQAMSQPIEDQYEVHTAGERGDAFYLAWVSPFFNRRGRWTGSLLLLQDITDYKLAENQMVLAQEHLIGQLAQIEDLQTQLREQAIRDPLTGLFNRRHLMSEMESAVRRAELEKSVFAVAMIDIDHFKQVNDTYGHKAGDLMLQALAQLFLHNVRSHDVVCRYGGEEFVLVLPGMPPEIALQRAEHLRASFAGLAVEYEGVSFSASLSIGLAAYPTDSLDGEGLLRCADQALYEAKAAGRNRVKLWSEMRIPFET